MIKRGIIEEARYVLSQHRALCLTGPRQSGKTTLAKLLFKGKPYVNFEHPGVQAKWEEDPEGFMASLKSGAVLDEVQRVPQIFRYLQLILDKSHRRGQFILTGSNNFLLQEQVSQSLAGRAGYLTLLPLSYQELCVAKMERKTIVEHIYRGGYPEVWGRKLDASTWMRSYIQTYVERDVRAIKNITNLSVFSRFLQLCAGYAGQLMNRDEISKLCGVDNKTIQSWLGILESSYVIFLLPPWTSNITKRTIKSPKLYFYDTALLCRLLGLGKVGSISTHEQYGALFENWVVSEIRKNRFNTGEQNGMYFFRDSAGNEIDLILQKDTGPMAIEIKSSKTAYRQTPDGLRFWNKYFPSRQSLLIHGGESSGQITESIGHLSWKGIADI